MDSNGKFVPQVDVLDKSVAIEWSGRRYEVYFDRPEHACFFGEHGNGAMIVIPAPGIGGSIIIYPDW